MGIGSQRTPDKSVTPWRLSAAITRGSFLTTSFIVSSSDSVMGACTPGTCFQNSSLCAVMSTRASMVLPPSSRITSASRGMASPGFPGQHLVFGRLVQEYARKKRFIGQMAALLKNIVDRPIFLRGQRIQRMVRHGRLATQRCAKGGECDQTQKEGSHQVSTPGWRECSL